MPIREIHLILGGSATLIHRGNLNPGEREYIAMDKHLYEQIVGSLDFHPEEHLGINIETIRIEHRNGSPLLNFLNIIKGREIQIKTKSQEYKGTLSFYDGKGDDLTLFISSSGAIYGIRVLDIVEIDTPDPCISEILKISHLSDELVIVSVENRDNKPMDTEISYTLKDLSLIHI